MEEPIIYKPKKKPRPIYTIEAVSVAVIVISLLLDHGALVNGWSYRWIFQLIAFLAVVVFINYTNRYLFTEFTYIIDNGNFIVGKKQGKRASEICNLNLSTAISLMTKAEFRLYSKGKAIRCYSYTQNLSASDAIVYVFEFNGETGAVIIEANEAFSQALRREIDIAKRNAEE